MKKKILAHFVYVIAAAMVITMIMVTLLAYNLFEQRLLNDLRLSAQMIDWMIEEAGIDSTSDTLGDELRLSLIAPDGTVLYDSEVNAGEMENHRERPEVFAAFEEGSGSAVRESNTLQSSTFYYAMRRADGSVLRVADEAASIWNIYLQAMPLLLVVIALMMGMCFFVANALTVRLIKPIEQMTSQLDDINGTAAYPELEPFMQMIKKQHDEILSNADMRVEFTANVSHELKTPLTSISGYAELIENGMAQDEQATHFAHEIHKSANRLLTLINDIIRLSQMDAPTSDLNLETVDLGQVAADTVAQLRLNAERAGVTLQLEERQAMIEADKGMMEELLYNLCDNAIRYNVRGGSVRVQVRQLRESIILCVQDNGIGISKENQEHVFERFYRVDKSRSKATGGTGLGLAIVKHIAAKHHARIQLQSEPGIGTSIEVIFDRCSKTEKEKKHGQI